MFLRLNATAFFDSLRSMASLPKAYKTSVPFFFRFIRFPKSFWAKSTIPLWPQYIVSGVDVPIFAEKNLQPPSYSAVIANSAAELIIARQGARFISIYDSNRCKGMRGGTHGVVESPMDYEGVWVRGIEFYRRKRYLNSCFSMFFFKK